mgnify:CR=1 FL=1
MTEPNSDTANVITGDSIYGYSVDRVYDAYLDTALWSTADHMESDAQENRPLDDWFGHEDIADATRKEMWDVVSDFLANNGSQLAEAGLSAEQAGENLWLTQERHGAGFWDLGIRQDLGRQLTQAARAYDPVDISEAIKPDSRAWVEQQKAVVAERDELDESPGLD